MLHSPQDFLLLQLGNAIRDVNPKPWFCFSQTFGLGPHRVPHPNNISLNIMDD